MKLLVSKILMSAAIWSPALMRTMSPSTRSLASISSSSPSRMTSAFSGSSLSNSAWIAASFRSWTKEKTPVTRTQTMRENPSTRSSSGTSACSPAWML